MALYMMMTLTGSVLGVVLVVSLLKTVFKLRKKTAKRLYILGGLLLAVIFTSDAGTFNFVLRFTFTIYLVYVILITVVGLVLRSINKVVGNQLPDITLKTVLAFIFGWVAMGKISKTSMYKKMTNGFADFIRK